MSVASSICCFEGLNDSFDPHPSISRATLLTRRLVDVVVYMCGLWVAMLTCYSCAMYRQVVQIPAALNTVSVFVNITGKRLLEPSSAVLELEIITIAGPAAVIWHSACH